MKIRQATVADLDRLIAIYNQAVASGRATGDTEPFSPEERKAWFVLHDSNERTPIFVCEDGGRVVGYSYLSAYRAGRKALEGVAEISYYVDYAHHHKGVGGSLLVHTLASAEKLGYRDLLAIVLSCNQGSIRLLEKVGFERWGVLPDIVHIGDAVYSHHYYGRKLGEQKGTGRPAPAEGKKVLPP